MSRIGEVNKEQLAWYEAGMRDAEVRLTVECESRVAELRRQLDAALIGQRIEQVGCELADEQVRETIAELEQTMGEASGLATRSKTAYVRERKLRKVWMYAALTFMAIDAFLARRLWLMAVEMTKGVM